ncbi:MAG: filamentous hemagglutinin N-terminal domain-containing protein, partial [Syntrophaceae bacterium]|nr:filamentous hemagglutinin N-terminal domain-containing protein [Syntrophaceae bacterium]
MNKFYQRIWSKVKERWIIVSQNVIYHGDYTAIFGAITLAAFLSFSGTSSALEPGALPTGGKITSGKGSISTAGSQMTVTQSTDKMIANWNTFNIGKRAGVTFKQPDADSAALNRIYDQKSSQILGTLSANGKIYLINPSGIIFGEDSQVNVSGLVASTLNIADSDFLVGRYTFLNTGNAGSILNQGKISVIPGGIVALIAPSVTNEGTITANGGSVILGAGNQITLDFTGDGLISYKVDKGAIDALAENKGLIQADGGLVVMTAEAANDLTNAVVNNSGIIEAQTLENKGGRIILMSDMDSGTTTVGGKMDASAPNGGNGGFIETSGKDIKINDSAVVTTAAPIGNNGTWLIDPYNFTIAASGGDVTGAALTTALASNSVTIQTLSGSVSCTGVTCGTGNPSGNGDIFVNDNITWSQNTLTLNAYRNIEINSELFGSGTAKLSLLYGQGAVASGNSAIYKINAPVNLPAGNNFSTKLGSDGTTINYYVIISLGAAADATSGTNQTLQGMARTGNLFGYYALGSNIDAMATSTWNAGLGFSPIGNSSTQFTGKFDGLGHTISNLTINRPSQNYVALFGYAGSGNTIKYVGLIGGSISGNNFVGGLVGYNRDTVTNSYVTGSVSGANRVGGLVGYNDSTSAVSNAYATGSVSGTGYVGGLVGYNGSTSIVSNAYATGSVSGTDQYIGGLVGYNDSASAVSNAYATG